VQEFSAAPVVCHNRSMALEYFDWEVGDVIVLHLQGPLTLGEGTRRFRTLIHEKLEAGKKNILLNMAEVYYIDSSGLGELVAANTTIHRHGGTLKLMKLAPRVKDLVQLTKVYQVFEVFNDEDSAVRSFCR
jgi:anti-sigma B factor antagonist